MPILIGILCGFAGALCAAGIATRYSLRLVHEALIGISLSLSFIIIASLIINLAK